MRRLRWLWSAPGRWPRIAMAAACALVVVLYFANRDMNGEPDAVRGDGKYHPVLARGDGHMLYLMARSTALDLDWSFDNDLARFGDPWREPRTATGRKSIIHPIGPALVWTPMIWLAELGAVVANVFGADIPLHGYTLWHQRIVFLSSALFACGAVLLGRRLARRWLPGWSTTYAAIAVLLGTPITYYATNMPSYSHAMDAFACAAFLAYWAETIDRCDRKRWIVLGVLLGVAALVRTQELAMGAVVAFEVGVHVVRERGRAWRWLVGGAIVLAIAFVVLIPQFIEWQVVFGTFRELPQGARYTRATAPMIGELLWAPRNGWFSSTPIAYAGVIGLFCLPRRARTVAIGLGIVVAMQVYLNSTVLDWWASASFGQRRLCSVTLPLVVGLAALGWRIGRLIIPRIGAVATRIVLAAVLAPFIGWNLWRVGQHRHGLAAPSELEPTCCGITALRPFGWIYDRIGNPFEFPANAVFAIEHGVGLDRWDQVVADYPLVPSMGELHGDKFYATRGAWHLESPERDKFLLDGWGPPTTVDGRACRRIIADTATVLVPNLMPDRQRVTLWLHGPTPAVIEWNGRTVSHVNLDAGWSLVELGIRDLTLHTNELAIHAEGACVGALEVSLVKP
jgi:hypothetical protein